ncbi:MAG: hypothetical protein A3F84_00775 [Candidatus Handelsmanbacteria bacterium RIFCSPLOWO2_12_FULL_64_10]|uniref:Lipoprotein n=1 Tax=Handelsmanbacteria sp. (strain RIFCSPLOWO2_12_FULL_64_10) TaxID=1817868 RepID=A0A1F6CRK3_HANXR|nr:MAG: hypothetical protein A3F84_00775 [Candidatus Handelsmanbacteria bacterium RIFCSPLOWO2_12_FULL_64_10]
MFRRCKTTRAILTALTLSGVALIGGCGGLSRPLAPDLATVSKSPPSKASFRAAKKASHTREDRRRFSRDRDDKMEVNFSNYGDDRYDVRVENAQFHVRRGSIHEDREISVTAYSGATANDVAFDFSPDGFVFDQPASLTINLRGPVNPRRLKAYHISSGGAVTQIPFDISRLDRNRWQVTLQVPGFSIYTLGDELSLVPETMAELGLGGY